MDKLLIKLGTKLSQDEIDQINEAKTREFKVSPRRRETLSMTFFLLVDGERILATGELVPIKPVSFSGKNFSILGIGGILANKKGKGYGRQIMTAIKNYLITNDRTGVGFCSLHNKGFYEKCGFNVDTTSIKRFIFWSNKKKVTNSGDDCVLYLDAFDRFMQKVLSRPDEEIILPRPPDW